MNTEKVYDENGQGFVRMFSDDEVEKVNPIEYYKTFELEKRAITMRDLLYAKNPFLTSQLEPEFFRKKAEESLVGFFEEYEKAEIHKNFIKLLDTTRKRDQEALLKGMTISTAEILALAFKSYTDYGFLYSKYLFETLPAGFEGKKLPKLFRLLEDDTIEKIGETDCSDGELKKIIHQRKVIVSHFFENGDFWHCFFLTYASIGGKENWKSGQTHFHYISSSFGVSKSDFIDSMKTGRYKSTSIHIDLIDYGQQSGQ